MSTTTEYRLGELNARVTTLESQNAQLLEEMVAMRKDMAEVRNVLAEAKGGVRTLLWVGSVGAAIGGMIGWAINTWLKVTGNV